MKKRRRVLIGVVILLLYVITGVHGPRRHLADITTTAQRTHAEAVKWEEEQAELFPEEGLLESRTRHLRPDGPSVGLKWAIPILPGVLIADSYEVIGPLWGRGGPRIVFYFGVWSFYINTPFGWIS